MTRGGSTTGAAAGGAGATALLEAPDASAPLNPGDTPEPVPLAVPDEPGAPVNGVPARVVPALDVAAEAGGAAE